MTPLHTLGDDFMTKFKFDPIYNEEFADTIAKAKPLITDTSFCTLLMSDAHIEYSGGLEPERPGIMRQLDAIKALADEIGADAIMLGGDMIHGTNSYEGAMSDLNTYAEVLKDSTVPVLPARGNHDDNGYHNTNRPPEITHYDPHYCPISFIVNQQMWVDTLVDRVCKDKAIHADGDPKSTYYYADFEDKKVRMIFLDAYDSPYVCSDGEHIDTASEGWNHVSDEQIHWLCDVALDLGKDGWNFIVCSHAPLKNFGSYRNHTEIMGIFSAFNNREIYKNDRLGIIKDFTKATSSAPLQLFGHTHLTVTKSCTKEKMQLIGVGSAKISFYDADIPRLLAYGDYDYGEMHPRKAGDYTEANIDVVIMDKGIIHKIRFGAGIDQRFDVADYMNY